MTDNPFTAPKYSVATRGDRPRPHGPMRLASRGRRWAAAALDAIFIALGLAVVVIAFINLTESRHAPPVAMQTATGLAWWREHILTVMISFGVFVMLNAYHLSRYGQTLGKRFLGIQMVDAYGQPQGFIQLVALRYGLQYVFGCIPILGGIIGLLDILCIFTKDRRCLHDSWGRTWVVRVDTTADEVFHPLQLPGEDDDGYEPPAARSSARPVAMSRSKANRILPRSYPEGVAPFGSSSEVIAPLPVSTAHVDAPTPTEVIDDVTIAPPLTTPVPIDTTGLINGRYEVLDTVDDWLLGQCQRCRDRKSGAIVQGIRIGNSEAVGTELSRRVQELARVAPAGGVTPIQAIVVQAYRSRCGHCALSSGDLVLIFPDRDSQAFLSGPLFGLAKPPGVEAVTRLLRPIATILDALADHGVAFRRLAWDHLRLEGGQRPTILLAAPFLPQDSAADSDPIVQSEHPRVAEPATVVAAMVAIALSDSPLRRPPGGHPGELRPLTGVPAQVNQRIQAALAAGGPGCGLSATAWLDSLAKGLVVRAEDYLAPPHIAALRTDHGLDEAGIIRVIRTAVALTRPGVNIAADPEPAVIGEDALDAALLRLRRERNDERTQRSYARWDWGLLLGAAVATVAMILAWFFSDRTWAPSWQDVPGQESSIRGVFAIGRSFTGDLPVARSLAQSGDHHLAFYVQWQNLPLHGRRIEVRDEQDRQLMAYSLPNEHATGWVYLHFPASQAAGARTLTGRFHLGDQLILDRTIPVREPWFGRWWRTLLTLVVLWVVVFGIRYVIERRLTSG